jgi:hypothetical protein
MASIEGMVIEREVLVRRIGKLGPKVDTEEQLSERVIWIDEALNELHDHYEEARIGETIYPHASDFIEGCRRQIGVLLGPA